MTTTLEALCNIPGSTTHHGIDDNSITQYEVQHGFCFPDAYKQLLRSSNGLEGYFGYYRIFGLGCQDSIDGDVWNRPDYWRFAWQQRCDPFWFFGETAWGDQYAFPIDALQRGVEPLVYFVEGLGMTPEVISSSFTEFLENEFSRNATHPYDEMIIRANSKFGNLDIREHLIYTPSILLGGQELLEHVQKMNSRSAMVCNGDVATQLDNLPRDSSVIGVEPYEDSERRLRLRLRQEKGSGKGVRSH